jgi:NADPH-dependent curcumin reductase CurA
MTAKSNKGIILKAYPKGMPKVDEHFELVHRTIDIENLDLKENEFILRSLYLSIDPYVRVTLKEPVPTSAITVAEKEVPLGQVILGNGISEVVKTNNPNYKIGDLLNGITGK